MSPVCPTQVTEYFPVRHKNVGNGGNLQDEPSGRG